MAVSWSAVRTAVVLALATCFLVVILVLTGEVTSPFGRRHVHHVRVWLRGSAIAASPEDQDQECGCLWNIGCPDFPWQTNFTSPKFRCGFEPMTENLLTECLAERNVWHGRPVRVHVAGHVREAYLVDYMRRRLGAEAEEETCRLVDAAPGRKNISQETVEYDRVEAKDGGETCRMVYKRDGLTLEYKLLGLLGPDIFEYVERLVSQCREEGCAEDLLIMSGGVAEQLNSTILDSFTGVRRFQRHYRRLLPMLIHLVTEHNMQVVWKIHEPVTDEFIPEYSMVRNDLLQEYNALIMEQTMTTPVEVWTSHMMMKLHHIEECESQIKHNEIEHISDPLWRCEEEWVAGDSLHAEYFDTIFNRVCDKMVSMPKNPCCSG